MRKKIICCIFLFIIVNSSFADGVDAKVSDQNNQQLSNIVLAPVKFVTISAISIAMIPVGAFKGFVKGASISPDFFDSDREHDDSIMVKALAVPIGAAGFALGGAIYMAYQLPIDTFESLNKTY